MFLSVFTQIKKSTLTHARCLQDICIDEYDACTSNNACAACRDGAVEDEECPETLNPTTCSDLAAHYCCRLEAMPDCSTNALLLAILSE